MEKATDLKFSIFHFSFYIPPKVDKLRPCRLHRKKQFKIHNLKFTIQSTKFTLHFVHSHFRPESNLKLNL